MNESTENQSNWERKVLERIADNIVTEQRRARRWSTFFKLLAFAWVFWLIILLTPSKDWGPVKPKTHTALITVSGMILDTEEANADAINRALKSAFEEEEAKGIILSFNSPGGSPVQAGFVYDEIVRLKAKFPEKKLYAVVKDLCMSGAYYIASAADEIYADKASLVGSIGVLVNGFGFVSTLEKLGIERRLLTAGKNKGIMDPFSPENESDNQFIQASLDTVHRQFIDSVKKGRGDRLKNNDAVFTGLFWTGDKALEMGLIDNLGSSDYVAREVIGEEEVVDYTKRQHWFERFSEHLGTSFSNQLASLLGLNNRFMH